jgi:hypothetical protein
MREITDKEIQKYINSLAWSEYATQHEKDLVNCNIRTFANLMAKKIKEEEDKEKIEPYAEGKVKNNFWGETKNNQIKDYIDTLSWRNYDENTKDSISDYIKGFLNWMEGEMGISDNNIYKKIELEQIDNFIEVLFSAEKKDNTNFIKKTRIKADIIDFINWIKEKIMIENEEKIKESVSVNIYPVEKKRTYIFKDKEIFFNNVSEVCVQKDGSHFLRFNKGYVSEGEGIINPGWLAMKIDK